MSRYSTGEIGFDKALAVVWLINVVINLLLQHWWLAGTYALLAFMHVEVVSLKREVNRLTPVRYHPGGLS